MLECYKSGDFAKYFNENMKAMKLPVPSTLFDSFTAAVSNAGVMLDALNTLGKGATVAELIKATTGLEKLKVAASLGAAFYVGAVIGSIAVASGRSLGCGASLADMFVFMKNNKLEFKGWREFYSKNPEVLNASYKFRRNYFSKSVAAASSV